MKPSNKNDGYSYELHPNHIFGDLLKKRSIATRSVHAGEQRDPSTGAMNTPIYLTSTFGFDTVAQQNEAVADRKSRYLYTRWGNPTIDAAERKIADLEGGEDALVLASGMAAISSVFLGLLKTGDHIVACEDCYGGTLTLLNHVLPKFGITVSFVPSGDSDALRTAIQPGRTKIVYVESPTNPLLRLVDLAETARIAHENDCLAVCDNTFATPINQRPLEQGFDLVCHSGTKYLGGHTDIIAGAVVGSQQLIDELWSPTMTIGGTTDAMTAWLLLRGIKTLSLRVERQNNTALRIAEYLNSHPAVKKVHYPGLPSHPHHGLAMRQMSGFGGMLSFELDASYERTVQFLESIELIQFAPSLGGVESLLTQPAATSHSYLPREERDRLGITDSLIRLSVGIEEYADLEAALRTALVALK